MNDFIDFTCAKCQVRMRAPVLQAGIRGQCQKCGEPFVVPALFEMNEPTVDAPAPPAKSDAAPAAEPAMAAAPPAPERRPSLLRWGLIAAIVVAAIMVGVFALRGQEKAELKPTSPVAPAAAPAAAPTAAPVAPAFAPPAVGPIQPVVQLSPEEEELQRLQKERDKLAREVNIQRQKRMLEQEVERLKKTAEQTDAKKANATQPLPQALAQPPVASGPRSIAEVAKMSRSSVVVVRSTRPDGSGTGAGFMAFTRNHIVTNYHVVSGGRNIQAVFHLPEQGRMTRNCTVQAVDAANDLALLQFSSEAPSAALPLPFAEQVEVGGEVIAIGNPGMGAQILEHSVSNGIISALDRVVADRRYLQTTAAINPGNSGGPLLDLHGRVVGVVSAKATQQENIGFAVPIALVQTLYDEREGRFKVEGDLLSWEAKMPLRNLRDQPGAISVGSIVADMHIDEDGQRLVATLPERNRIVVIDLAMSKIDKEIFAGTDPLDIQPAGRNQIWVSHLSSRNLALVNIQTGKIERKVGLRDTPLDFTVSKSGIWYMGGNGTLNLMPLAGGEERNVRLNVRSLVYNGSRNNMWCGAANGWLVEIDGDRMTGLFARRDALDRDIDSFNKQANRGEARESQYKILTRRKQELDDAIEKCIKAWNQPPGLHLDYSSHRQVLINDVRNGRIYFNGCAMESKAPDKIIGVFKSPEHSLAEQQGLRDLYHKYPLLRQIRAVSPDGKLACSGTHLFRTDDFTIVKQLPVPSTAVEFSPDSKRLWIADPFNLQIVSLDLAAEMKPSP